MPSWPQVARRIRVPSGFAFAAVYLWLARPLARSLMFGAGFVVLGLLIRGLASGHLQKNRELATTGPYAWTRNPLYLGSLIIGVGFAIAARSLWIAVLLLVMLFAIYLPVIRSEEEFLAAQFPKYADYAHRVPRFVPRVRPAAHRDWEFSWGLYWKHREYNATLGAAAIMAALVLKLLRNF
ncbi:MAG: isoprenylcysteine carboxylmethyltransferase family protein [Acidobacteriia bacterium]|nr:isoprenylcysteine carboxylmethyltransferase family protein [Terriglobia bacterium]